MIPAWEYAVMPVGMEPEDMAEAMDELGRDGWELVVVTPYGGGMLMAFFKRRRAA